MFTKTLPRYTPWPGRAGYLELHARRVTGLDNPRLTDAQAAELWDNLTQMACGDFERTTGAHVYLLGRSSRHVCVPDAPENSRRYQYLRRLALRLLDTAVAQYNAFEPEEV
jgi:hypothetical protein